MALETPIKHTSAGEMPDTSMGAELERRLEADIPLLSDPKVIQRLALPLLAVGVGLGLFFFWRSRKLS